MCDALAEYWDVPVDGQTESTAPARVLEFLNAAARGSAATSAS
jgi:hypothetical protein